eukprot:TRINITY_DN53_c0_g1_i2.p1 TRINITY_DN53_c0_g1~~TRINITY_DN53_c0_g1_i2.p1  ORF type:complete len:304 (+),score=82.80 TRINITY_DN53_c0_g1_i2:83-913(+)
MNMIGCDGGYQPNCQLRVSVGNSTTMGANLQVMNARVLAVFTASSVTLTVTSSGAVVGSISAALPQPVKYVGLVVSRAADSQQACADNIEVTSGGSATLPGCNPVVTCTVQPGVECSGTLPSSGVVVSATIPDGAVTTADGSPLPPLTITQTTPPSAPLPSDVAGAIYLEIGFDSDVVFHNVPMSVSLDLTDYASQLDSLDVDLYIFVNGGWKPAGETCDPVKPSERTGDVLTVYICHFTPFALVQKLGLNSAAAVFPSLSALFTLLAIALAVAGF